MISTKVQLRLSEEKMESLGELGKIFLGEGEKSQEVIEAMLLKPSEVVRSLIPCTEFADMLRAAHEHQLFSDYTINGFISQAIATHIKTLLADDKDHPIDLSIHQIQDSIDACRLYKHFIYAKAGVGNYIFVPMGDKFVIAADHRNL